MQEYYGSCHCGNVNFKFLSENKVEIWKCNCSICNMYDYQHLFVKHEDFTLLDDSADQATYTFGTQNAKHLFCKACGIKSYYQPRSHPDMFSINLRCVKNPPDVYNVVEFDGINFEDSIKEI